MLRYCLIVVYVAIGSALSQNSTDNVTSSIHHITTTTNATTSQPLMMTNATTASTTTTTTVSPSTPSSSSSAAASASAFELTTNATTQENCSACISSFQMIYQNPNYSSVADNSIAMPTTCPLALYPTNDSCFSFVYDNCSVIIKSLLTVNPNMSFGLACSNSGIRVMKWTDCPPAVENSIESSNKVFCKLGNFSCSNDRNGVLSMNKIEVLEPLRKARECVIPVTTRAPIPLLPNPVGPGAITAIVVLICLFIVGVLAGFFFWPKCHMAEIPVQQAPKKKKGPPPVEAFNVAYASPAVSPTGVANVSIAVPPNQFARGPAAA